MTYTHTYICTHIFIYIYAPNASIHHPSALSCDDDRKPLWPTCLLHPVLRIYMQTLLFLDQIGYTVWKGKP